VPRWVVHEEFGELCGIARDVMSAVNRLVDVVLEHDAGRLIAYGHWDAGEFYRYASRIYNLLGCEGVKAFIHHHLMDYCCTIMRAGKYGYLFKYVADSVRRCGFARLYEDVDSGQLYVDTSVRGLLRTVDLREGNATNALSGKIIPMILTVVENMAKDFSGAERDGVVKCVVDAVSSMRCCIEESARRLLEMLCNAAV